jgi:hypothetical protein
MRLSVFSEPQHCANLWLLLLALAHLEVLRLMRPSSSVRCITPLLKGRVVLMLVLLLHSNGERVVCVGGQRYFDLDGCV